LRKELVERNIPIVQQTGKMNYNKKTKREIMIKRSKGVVYNKQEKEIIIKIVK
jgi:hypothetical protein